MTATADDRQRRSRIKRAMFAVAAVVVALLVAAAAAEILANAYLLARDRRYVSPRARLAALDNTFIAGITRADRNCRYIDTLYPHPYLAFVHHGNPPCGIPDVNNIGLFGPDYPSERPADRFVVLVTGGSVAAQFMQAGVHGVAYLQENLERNYVSPTGRPFLLLNGGDGAWHQPQQLILFLLYADAVHAVVTLDGFNERYFVGSSVRFEYPANNFMDVNPLVNASYSEVVKRWVAGKLYARAASSRILSRSQLAYLVLARIDAYLKEQRQLYTERERTNLNTMLALPAGWTTEHRIAWADGQYRKYIRAMDAVAAQHGVLAAHFLQPVPAIAKPLTEEERAVVGDLAYRALYERITRDVLGLAREGTPVFSLLDVFAARRDTLYADTIHLRQAADGSSQGYALIAERIAAMLAAEWHLRPKTPGPRPVNETR
jgi:hypothetical protein